MTDTGVHMTATEMSERILEIIQRSGVATFAAIMEAPDDCAMARTDTDRIEVKFSRDPLTNEPAVGLFLLRCGEFERAEPDFVVNAEGLRGFIVLLENALRELEHEALAGRIQ